MSLITFKNLPDTTTPLTAENLNNNFDYLNDVEEITSSISFGETVGANTHFYKKGNQITVFFQGETKTHSIDDTLATIPSQYRPRTTCFIPFIKNGNAYGILNINSENGLMRISQLSSTSANGRIYCTFTYFI